MNVEFVTESETETKGKLTITTVSVTQETEDGKGVMMDMDDIRELAELVESNEFTDNHRSYIIRGLAPQGWRTLKGSNAELEDLDEYYQDFVKHTTKFKGLFQVQVIILH